MHAVLDELMKLAKVRENVVKSNFSGNYCTCTIQTAAYIALANVIEFTGCCLQLTYYYSSVWKRFVALDPNGTGLVDKMCFRVSGCMLINQ